jgi:hypothetical protein
MKQPGNNLGKPGRDQAEKRHQTGNNWQQPCNTRHQPGNSRQQPGNSRQQPGNTRQQPGNSRQQLGNSRQQPGNSRQQLGNSRQQPGNSRQRPGNSRQQPDNGKETNKQKQVNNLNTRKYCTSTRQLLGSNQASTRQQLGNNQASTRQRQAATVNRQATIWGGNRACDAATMQAVINQLATRQPGTSQYTFIKEQAVFLLCQLLNPSCSFSY